MKSLTLKEIVRYDLIMGIISLITAFSAVIIPIYKHHSELHSLSFLNLFFIIVIYEIVAFSALLIILLVLKSVLKLIYFYKDRLEILKKR